MAPIMELADRHGLLVIEDAAQAIGTEYRGRRAGSIGHYGCFSFLPSKNLGGAGDGGMIVTRDKSRAERLRVLRAHGAKLKYYHAMIGGNFRLDAVQAAVRRCKNRLLIPPRTMVPHRDGEKRPKTEKSYGCNPSRALPYFHLIAYCTASTRRVIGHIGIGA